MMTPWPGTDFRAGKFACTLGRGSVPSRSKSGSKSLSKSKPGLSSLRGV